MLLFICLYVALAAANECHNVGCPALRHTIYLQAASQTRAPYTTEEVEGSPTLVPPAYVPLLAPIALHLTIKVLDDLVVVQVPPFAFFLPYSQLVPLPTEEGFINQPENNYGRGGYLLTVAGSLPRHLWHDSAQPLAFPVASLGSPLPVVYYLSNSGDLIVATEDFAPLYNPSNVNYTLTEYFSVYGATLHYLLPRHRVTLDAANVPLQAWVSNFSNNQLFSASLQGLYFSDDFFDGVHASVFPGNPSGETENVSYNLYATLTNVAGGGHQQTSVTRPVYAPPTELPPHYGFEIDAQQFTNAQIALNPTAEASLVINALVIDLSQSGNFFFQYLVAYSQDGGQSWHSSLYNESSPLFLSLQQTPIYPILLPSVGLFDAYGNYWLAWFYVSPEDQFYAVALLLSTDGGISFNYTQSVSFSNKSMAIIDVDLRFGFTGGNDNEEALFVTGTAIAQPPPAAQSVFLCWSVITGLGQWSPMYGGLVPLPQAPAGANAYIVQPQLVVAPNGALALMGATPVPFANINTITGGNETGFLSWPTGTGNYANYFLFATPGIYELPQLAGPLPTMTTNLAPSNQFGGFFLNVNSLGKGVPFLQQTNPSLSSLYNVTNVGLWATSLCDVAFDPTEDALWVVYSDQKPPVLAAAYNASQRYSMSIFALVSYDFGLTWSDQILVSDSARNARGLATLSIDPLSGVKAVGFFDGRLDVGNGGLTQYTLVTFK